MSRKIITTTFVTLDGVMQAPGGPQEDASGGFTQGGWPANYWDESMGKIISSFMQLPFELLLGKRTYDIFAAFWPNTDQDPSVGRTARWRRGR
jgi:dihydrofolate reductase